MTQDERERFALEESIRMEVHKQYRKHQWGRFFKFLFVVLFVLPLISIILLALLSTVVHKELVHKDNRSKQTIQHPPQKVKAKGDRT